MALHTQQHNDTVEHMREIPKAKTKGIWKVFFILCALTAVEFAFAFMMEPGTLRNSIFIILTLAKGFYIVAEFMHLKHETKSLIWTIMIPTILLAWLLVALLVEGSFYGDSVFNYFK